MNKDFLAFLKSTLESLDTHQKNIILTTEDEYINFSYKVANAGFAVSICTTNQYPFYDPLVWNGYDFTATTSETVILLNELGLISTKA